MKSPSRLEYRLKYQEAEVYKHKERSKCNSFISKLHLLARSLAK